jgi:Flp pilus assembly protein TadD
VSPASVVASHAGGKGDSARLKRLKGESAPRAKLPLVPAVPAPGEAAAVVAASPAAAPPVPPEAPRGAREIVQEGERLLGQGSVNQACVRGEEARKLFPKFAPTYKFLGKCYMREGRAGDSKDAYRKYLELSPSAPDAAFIEEIIKQK